VARNSEVIILDIKLACVGLSGTRCDLDTSLLVVSDSLLKEVGLSLKRDHIHPLEGVLHIVLLGNSE